MNAFQDVKPLEQLDNKRQELATWVNRGALRYYKHVTIQVQERIDFELSVIDQKGTGWYFLLVAEIVAFAKVNNIWVGAGRGSAAGSIVNYCLGITSIDPLEFGLLFERFYHEDSVGLPNIELDIEVGGRAKIIKYLKHIYGNANTLELMNEKGLPHSTTIAISNRILPEDLTFDTAMELACVTLDLLPCKSLTALKNAFHALSPSQIETLIDLTEIEFEDQKTIRLFQQGLTEGIPYFDGGPMQDLLREFVPQNFEDLVLLFAVLRPTMQDQISLLKEIKKGNLFKLVPDQISSIVSPSYGLIAYQEQVMQIVEQIASFSPEEADALRKSLGKKQYQKITGYKLQFLNEGMANGHSEELLHEIWEEIMIAGPNVFNKSHSVCYTKTAFQLAYIKANY